MVTKNKRILIENGDENREVSNKGIEDKTQGYPIFCFKYLSSRSFKNSKDFKFLSGFLLELKRLSNIGWAAIYKSNYKYKDGIATLSVKKIKPDLPQSFSGVKSLIVFRASKDNRPFLGIRIGKTKVFSVLFIETKFGDIYNHGKKK